MAEPDPRAGPDRRMRLARLVTLVAMAAAPLTSLVMAGIGLWQEPSAPRTAIGAVGVLAVALTQAGALYGAATPWLSERARRRLLTAFAVAAVLSVPLVAPVAPEQFSTWAWLGGSIAGTIPLVVGWRVAVPALLACLAASPAAAWWTGGSPGYYALTTGWLALAVVATAGFPVWLWAVLVQVQQGREAQARLAATEERLRFARDVHDLLGHHLTVIALKAELAARLAARDAGQAAGHAAEAQRLAIAALAETRAVVHGYRTVELAEQLAAVSQVLSSSGVRCTVRQPAEPVPAPAAAELAAVLREASTNLLRHSRASWCTIEIGSDGREVRMAVANDGAGDARPDRHSSGLRGLAERLGGAGGTLRTDHQDGVFTLTATVPVAP